MLSGNLLCLYHIEDVFKCTIVVLGVFQCIHEGGVLVKYRTNPGGANEVIKHTLTLQWKTSPEPSSEPRPLAFTLT